MTPELWQQLKPLFHAALDLQPADRQSYVKASCGENTELAHELWALLAAEQEGGNTLVPPMHDLLCLLPERPAIVTAGTVLGGRFRIVRPVGSGGMGDVYEAVDLEMGSEPIALKTIRPDIASNPVAVARFREEVRLARQISSPHVCRIHELYLNGAGPGLPGQGFLTMELLDGPTLHDRISAEGPLELAEMRSITEQLCAALCSIHKAGIIHRDLKPRNVMLLRSDDGCRVVITDFGLARAAAQAAAAADPVHADPGLIAGTPAYMAPEQFEGHVAGAATDLYALGLILYEMATGIQPFAADTPLAAAIRRSKVPAQASTLRPDLPSSWDDIIHRCLQYGPEQRFQRADEVTEALQRPAKMTLRLGATGRRVALPRTGVIVAVLVAMALLCGVLWYAFGRPRHRELAPEAARWYTMGVAALREGSYLKATRMLSMVTARDPTYALAHAALADAWTELDYTANAQHEMLLAAAPNEQRGLSDMDRQYIDAVRSTLVRDYSAAAQDYEAILRELPPDGKAQGYVDLGRIYEKAGRMPETVASYEHAARLNPDDPAPFLHLGILKSRLHDAAGAEAAFSSAQRLYSAESDVAGTAEVAYQQGYAANDAFASAKAREFLNQSLTLARQIPSVQLEVRSLSQLSSVAYNDSKDEEAIQYANQMMALARNNGLEYWVTDGLVRLGNAYLDKADYHAAEQALTDAVYRAQENNHPRLEATAALTLASLRDQQGRWDEVLPLAQRALTYFQDYGFLLLQTQALNLMARAQLGGEHYPQALAAGEQLLRAANASHRPEDILLAEELVGRIMLRLERYPEALSHDSAALLMAKQLHQNVAYDELARADALWQLGRTAEAQAELASLSPADRARVDTGSSAATLEARMRLSEGDPRGALAIVHSTWSALPQLLSTHQGLNQGLLRTTALSELALGQVPVAEQTVSRLAAGAGQKTPGAWASAQKALLNASLALHQGHAMEARTNALAADALFQQNGMNTSAVESLVCAAEAAEAAHDASAADDSSRKSVDILRHLQQSWGAPAFQQYLSRPDRQQMVRTLTRLRARSGDTLHDLNP